MGSNSDYIANNACKNCGRRFFDKETARFYGYVCHYCKSELDNKKKSSSDLFGEAK